MKQLIIALALFGAVSASAIERHNPTLSCEIVIDGPNPNKYFASLQFFEGDRSSPTGYSVELKQSAVNARYAPISWTIDEMTPNEDGSTTLRGSAGDIDLIEVKTRHPHKVYQATFTNHGSRHKTVFFCQ